MSWAGSGSSSCCWKNQPAGFSSPPSPSICSLPGSATKTHRGWENNTDGPPRFYSPWCLGTQGTVLPISGLCPGVQGVCVRWMWQNGRESGGQRTTTFQITVLLWRAQASPAISSETARDCLVPLSLVCNAAGWQVLCRSCWGRGWRGEEVMWVKLSQVEEWGELWEARNQKWEGSIAVDEEVKWWGGVERCDLEAEGLGLTLMSWGA